MGYLDDLRAEGLTIASRGSWGSTYNYSSPRTVYLPGRYLFLHIAVVNDPNDLVGTEDDVMRTIERIGISRFPSTGISYNAAAFDTGRIYDGQPLTRRGAHTINEYGISGYPQNLNYYGHAIVLPQQTSDPVTDAQVDAVARWGAAVVRAGYSRANRFLPHRMFAARECPGDRAVARLSEMNTLLRHYITEGLDMTAAEVWAHRIPHAGQTVTTASAATHLIYGRRSAEQAATAGQQVLARLGALESLCAQILAAVNAGAGGLTPEEITAAAKAGAEQALAEGVDLRISVDDQETPP